MLESIGKENNFLNLITKILKSTSNIFPRNYKAIYSKGQSHFRKEAKCSGKISLYDRGRVTTIYKGLKKGKYYS